MIDSPLAHHEHTDSSSERFILALILALIVHLLCIVFLLRHSSREIKHTLPPAPPASEIGEIELPIQRAKGSSFGIEPAAKIIYYDEPVAQPPAIASPQPLAQQPPAHPEPGDRVDAPHRPDQPESTPSFAIPLEIESPVIVPLTEPAKDIGTPQEQATPTKTESVPTTTDTQESEEPVNPFAPRFGQATTYSASAKKLQKIADGFLEAMEREGNDRMNIRSTREARQEDIATLSYVQQISHQLQQAFKSDTTVINIPFDEYANTLVTLVIDAHGEIADLAVQDPPHNHVCDQLIRTILYRAAPFPPIPKHLNRPLFIHRISISIHLPAGTHRPSWVCY